MEISNSEKLNTNMDEIFSIINSSKLDPKAELKLIKIAQQHRDTVISLQGLCKPTEENIKNGNVFKSLQRIDISMLKYVESLKDVLPPQFFVPIDTFEKGVPKSPKEVAPKNAFEKGVPKRTSVPKSNEEDESDIENLDDDEDYKEHFRLGDLVPDPLLKAFDGMLGMADVVSFGFLGPQINAIKTILNNLKDKTSIKHYVTSIIPRGLSNGIEVELSAVRVINEVEEYIGFSIRNIGQRVSQRNQNNSDLKQTATKLTELVGRVPLKDIVSETTDMIEKMCILSALELTMNNRVSASEMLGLSRQSLYIKMRRFGITEPNGQDTD